MDDLLSRYQALLATVDDWFTRCQTTYPDQIVCASGCSGCCRGLFDISLLDARLLRSGFDRLPAEVRALPMAQAQQRLEALQRLWPGFAAPYLLNLLPDDAWMAMPEDDLTPCPLLGADGRCLVYDWRPLTCRLHGVPQFLPDGEVWHEEGCSSNFLHTDPQQMAGLAWDFPALHAQEFCLGQELAVLLTGEALTELDTFIPLALLIDFDGFDWSGWTTHHYSALTRHR